MDQSYATVINLSTFPRQGITTEPARNECSTAVVSQGLKTGYKEILFGRSVFWVVWSVICDIAGKGNRLVAYSDPVPGGAGSERAPCG
jgi:hypothetical protein